MDIQQHSIKTHNKYNNGQSNYTETAMIIPMKTTTNNNNDNTFENNEFEK